MVKKAIKKVDGVNKVSVKLNTKKATVNYDESKTDIKTILEAIKTTSYEGKVIKP
jgi:mercuric ion binding protein